MISGSPELLGAPQKPPLSLLSNIWLTLRLTGERGVQTIASFGWLDTPAPHIVTLLWVCAVVGICAYGLARSARCRRVLPLLILVIVVLPVVFESPRINGVGTYWQGRYWLPLAVGLPLIAAVAEIRRWSPWIALVGLLVVAQIATFSIALHRFDWSPPASTAVVVTMFVIGQLLLTAFVVGQRNDKIAPPEAMVVASEHLADLPRTVSL